MSLEIAYDSAYDPPAPVIPVGIAAPESDRIVLVRMLVDSGADISVVPAAVAVKLKLPVVERVRIAGIGGMARQVPVYAARLRFAGKDLVARVVALPGEAILGRDLLGPFVVTLDGPRARLRMATPTRRRPS